MHHSLSTSKLSRLLSLPEELIVEILTYTTEASFVCLGQTCRTFRRIAQDNALKCLQKESTHLKTPLRLIEKIHCPLGYDGSHDSPHYSWRCGDMPEPDIPRKQPPDDLGSILRKSMLCQACQRYQTSGHDFFKSEENTALFEPKTCSSAGCGDGDKLPSHPAWQFINDKCLCQDGVVRVCPHVVLLREELRDVKERSERTDMFIYCCTCQSKTRLASRKLRGSSLVRCESTFVFFPILERHQSLEKLHSVDEIIRLIQHSNMTNAYICPHVDPSNDGFTRVLRPLVSKLMDRERWTEANGTQQRYNDVFYCCAYCDTEVCLTMEKLEGGTPGQIELVIQRFFNPDDESSWLTNVDLSHVQTHFRHKALQHLVWCPDAGCATNRRTKLAPILLLEQLKLESWSETPLERIKHKHTLRYHEARFPVTCDCDDPPFSGMGSLKVKGCLLILVVILICAILLCSVL